MVKEVKAICAVKEFEYLKQKLNGQLLAAVDEAVQVENQMVQKNCSPNASFDVAGFRIAGRSGLCEQWLAPRWTRRKDSKPSISNLCYQQRESGHSFRLNQVPGHET